MEKYWDACTVCVPCSVSCVVECSDELCQPYVEARCLIYNMVFIGVCVLVLMMPGTKFYDAIQFLFGERFVHNVIRATMTFSFSAFVPLFPFFVRDYNATEKEICSREARQSCTTSKQWFPC